MLIDKDNQQGLSTSGHIGHPIGEQTKIQGVKGSEMATLTRVARILHLTSMAMLGTAGNATQVNLTLMTKD